MGVTAGIFLASILLKEMRYLVYIRYLWLNYGAKTKTIIVKPWYLLKTPSCCFAQAPGHHTVVQRPVGSSAFSIGIPKDSNFAVARNTYQAGKICSSLGV
jgi:hypothetical protein